MQLTVALILGLGETAVGASRFQVGLSGLETGLSGLQIVLGLLPRAYVQCRCWARIEPEQRVTFFDTVTPLPARRSRRINAWSPIRRVLSLSLAYGNAAAADEMPGDTDPGKGAHSNPVIY